VVVELGGLATLARYQPATHHDQAVTRLPTLYPIVHSVNAAGRAQGACRCISRERSGFTPSGKQWARAQPTEQFTGAHHRELLSKPRVAAQTPTAPVHPIRRVSWSRWRQHRGLPLDATPTLERGEAAPRKRDPKGLEMRLRLIL
jgi:hypothetical protein